MTPDAPTARVTSINVGRVREVIFHGQSRTTGIWKQPVVGPTALSATGVAGDQQADPSAHGGPNKAVYAFAAEDATWWADQLGAAVPPGMFGENLTVRGMALNDALIGEQWSVGGAIVQVTQPRFPCWKLGLRMNDSRFPKRFLEAGRAGTYLSVIQGADVQMGDRIERIFKPGHSLSVGLIAHLNWADRPLALHLLEAAQRETTSEEMDALLTRAGMA